MKNQNKQKKLSFSQLYYDFYFPVDDINMRPHREHHIQNVDDWFHFSNGNSISFLTYSTDQFL